MQFVVDLSPAQAERLRLEAERLGVKPEELAKANEALYRRLEG